MEMDWKDTILGVSLAAGVTYLQFPIQVCISLTFFESSFLVSLSSTD